MKWLIRLLEALFGSKPPVDNGNIIPPAKSLPEIPSPAEVGNFPFLKIALVRGHGGNDPGAVGNGTNEVEYNTWVMDYVASKTTRNLECFKSDSSVKAVLSSLPFKPDITIQLHLNSYNEVAHGCEVLVIDGDRKSYAIAEKFAKEFTIKFGRKLRRPEAFGKKLLSSSDGGAASLKATLVGVKILVEPFFIDNKNDFLPKEEYAKFLLDFTERL